VRYAVRNEYAQRAVDVISRRTRLSFLNAQAALDVLPRVVDIMAEELGWRRARKREEIERAVEFLATMGLAPGAGAILLESAPNSMLERLIYALWRPGTAPGAKVSAVYSRAQFEAGEVDALRDVYLRRARAVAGQDTRLSKSEVIDLLRETPGYEDVSVKDYEYVLDEAGFRGKDQIDFDEFVEVTSLIYS
jgi:glycerol-3-phosphate dehydrogenase